MKPPRNRHFLSPRRLFQRPVSTVMAEVFRRAMQQVTAADTLTLVTTVLSKVIKFVLYFFRPKTLQLKFIPVGTWSRNLFHIHPLTSCSIRHTHCFPSGSFSRLRTVFFFCPNFHQRMCGLIAGISSSNAFNAPRPQYTHISSAIHTSPLRSVISFSNLSKNSVLCRGRSAIHALARRSLISSVSTVTAEVSRRAVRQVAEATP